MIAVLLVDDEPRVLEGLRDVLRCHRRNWSMVFAAGGEEALAAVERQPFDIVVSDIQMPRVDGVTVLEEVRRLRPETVRVVLSGRTDRASALRAIPVAHRVLGKPADPAQLQAAIERARTLRTIVPDTRARARAGWARLLPAQPEVLRALSAALAAGASEADAAAIVELDPALAAKVLQVAGWTFLSSGTPPTGIRKAVARVGTGLLRGIVDASAPASPGATAACRDIALHSVAVARRAAALAAPELADEAYAAGLVHDAGKLLQLTSPTSPACGATHAELGAYLLGTWGLPDGLVATLHRGRGGDSLAELVCSAHTGVAAAGPASVV
jgi:DNA-binding NarL/FixJ family response regulator